MSCFTKLLCSLFMISISQVAIAAGDGPSGYGSCIGCHGENGEGNTALKAPALAGQSATYLATQIRNFKNGLRGVRGDVSGVQMAAIASSLTSDQVINDIAQFLSNKPLVKHQVTVAGDLNAGRSIYNSSCSDCHGSQGEGFERLFAPALAGLRDTYLIDQFNKFKTMQRGYHEDDKRGRQMRFMSEEVSTVDSLNNVVAYIQTLSGNR